MLGVSHHSVGHIDIDLIRWNLPFGDYEFYLCGPAAFMKSLYDGLTGTGVPVDRIFYESFGPATVLKPEARQDAPMRPMPVNTAPVAVRFVRSDAGAEWARDRGTLLELAESIGLAPAFSCRSGICGTCTTRILSGAVEYIEEPVAPRGQGEVLLCCSIPRGDADVVLDL